MGWIKRNLYFSIGGLIALVLLGGAGFYTYVSWQRNNEAFTKLNDIYNKLKEISSERPQAGNDKVNNIKLAQEHEQQLRQWMSQARKHFKPIAPIPNPANGQYTSQMFGDALSRTIARLQDEAAAAGVGLPPAYKFSFQAESGAVKFAPGEPSATVRTGGGCRGHFRNTLRRACQQPRRYPAAPGGGGRRGRATRRLPARPAPYKQLGGVDAVSGDLPRVHAGD